MSKGFLPRRDSELLAWSANFKDLLLVNFAMYGILESQATFYSGLHTTFATKLELATEPITRTRVTVSEKDAAREVLTTNAKLLAKIIEGQANVTDAQKLALGLNVRKQPTPWPIPETAPAVTITNYGGNTLKVMLRDQDVQKRGKPPLTRSAAVYYWVGEEQPTENTPWLTFANTGRTMFNMEFPSSLPKGTQVWIIAAWMNGRGQFGPSCTPVSALLLGQSTFQAGNLKLAA